MFVDAATSDVTTASDASTVSHFTTTSEEGERVAAAADLQESDDNPSTSRAQPEERGNVLFSFGVIFKVFFCI